MSSHASSNQTATFLRKRFEEAGIRIKSRHGQNFLIDLNLQRLLVDSADLGPDDVVLEVGTGTGALTALMAPRVAAIVTVEIDPQLYQLASEELFGLDNVIMLQQDALKNKNNMHPTVLQTLREQLAGGAGRRLKLVANLPYSVATPVISNLLTTDIPPTAMTVTIQKELGDRIAAAPGTKDYGALSIWMQCQSKVELVRSLPPTVFWPRPKVTSSIIHVELDPVRRGRVADLDYFHSFVRGLFLHRRKFLRSVLVSQFKDQLTKEQVDAVLARLDFGPEVRAEQLDVERMLILSDAMQAAAAASKK
jgi:16S rRNA (adenine1518-N6/adenine1519-N6)-dimethyltransferase